jgi:hypothetical protein
LAPWESDGSKNINAHLREATLALMAGHQSDPLPDAVEQEIAHILKRSSTPKV